MSKNLDTQRVMHDAPDALSCTRRVHLPQATGTPGRTWETRAMTADGTRERTDLSDLAADRMEELGLSLRRLEALCIDPEAEGGTSGAEPLWKRGTLENLVKRRPIKAPDIAQLRALAAGLDVHISVVQEAAGAQFLGIDTVWSQDKHARAFVRGFREMSPEDQALVLAFIEEKAPAKLRRD
ncbi:MAG: XRE family transcriptional regulator [Streptomyces sp.]|nr:XRE family transcriptional regulator [Streptomyces sp.]